MPDTNKDVKKPTGIVSQLPSSSATRLSSFHGIRDLSLPGPSKPARAPAKRVIKPNFVARKSKNELAINLALQNHSKSLNKSEKAAYKPKTHRKTKEYFQTKGTLFDDTGLTAHRQMMASTASKLSRMQQAPKQLIQTIKLEATESDVNEDFISRLSSNQYSENNDFDPGLVPFNVNSIKANNNTNKSDLLGKFEQLKVKAEPSDEPDTDVNSNVSETATICGKSEMSLPEMIMSESEDLISFNFPGNMPGILPQFEEVKKTQEEIQESLRDKLTRKKYSKERFQIGKVDQGQIGTLKVYKSGKVELVLNKQTFVVSSGNYGDCHEELAYVHVDSDNKAGRMSMLGNVSGSYSLVPDIGSLIGEMRNDKENSSITF